MSTPTVNDVHSPVPMGSKMPYKSESDPSLPDAVKKLSEKARRQWVAVFNSIMEQHNDEGRAFAGANSAVRNMVEKAMSDIEADAERGKIGKSWQVEIVKADEERQIIYAVVLAPDKVDTQGDIISEDEIERSAHKWMEKSRQYDLHHKEFAREVAPVESFIAPQDLTYPNGKIIAKGSWIVASHVISPELWGRVKKGEFGSYSIRGWGMRRATPQQQGGGAIQ